jgi:hypothetical protein
MVMTERSHDGTLTVTAFVEGDGEIWLHRERFVYYTKREAVRLFREKVKARGWVIGK